MKMKPKTLSSAGISLLPSHRALTERKRRRRKENEVNDEQLSNSPGFNDLKLQILPCSLVIAPRVERKHTLWSFVFVFCFLFFVFLESHLQHMEVSRLGVQLELQPPAYTRATASRDLSHVCNLHHRHSNARSLTH